jgi:4-amino-4-deoxy-L-arabinose transferase-like glycosyltransferase
MEASNPEHGATPLAGSMSRQRTILIALLLLGAALRILVHDVPAYSRADETVYANFACRLASRGASEYRAMTEDFLRDPGAWGSPPPVRWAFIVPGAAAFVAADACSHALLAWLSTLASILALGLTFLVARRLTDDDTALVALALGVTSTLQLAMGRRALADAAFCACALLALWGFLALLEAEAPRRRDLALTVAALTLCLGVKETSVLLYPVLAAVLLVERGWRGLRVSHVAVFVLPLALHHLVFSLLVGDATLFFSVYAASTSTVGQEYAVQYQSGPPHRLLLDLLTLSPVVWIVALMGLGMLAHAPAPSRRERALAALFVLATLVFCVAPSKNLRYVILSDPLARIVAAWALVRWTPGRRAALALLATNAVVEWRLLDTVFRAGQVYDPVSDNLLRALKIIP